MSLREKQSIFMRMLGMLIDYAYMKGYQLTTGDFLAKTGHKKNSNHYIGLAGDLNLFKQGLGGKWHYCTRTEDHRLLGLYWEFLGGSWGGRFNDGNHYSLLHNGRR